MTPLRGGQSGRRGRSTSEPSGELWVVYLCTPGQRPQPCAVVRSTLREAAMVVAQERLFERGVVLAANEFLNAAPASECAADDVHAALQAEAFPLR
jgi:hypothetical protein